MLKISKFLVKKLSWVSSTYSHSNILKNMNIIKSLHPSSILKVLFFLFGIQPVLAFEVLDNGRLRFGTGSETSVNIYGNLQQPFYFDASADTFYPLTFGNRPLDNAIGVGGDGTNEWNSTGIISQNPLLTEQVLDVSGFIATSASGGYGTIISTGKVTIDGIDLEYKNTYILGENDSYMKITTRLTNLSDSNATNLRIWVGTGDDFVGLADGPTKQRGNLIDDAFVALSNSADQATMLRISTSTTGVLFYSTSPKAQVSINGCCSFSNAYNQDPSTSEIEATGDGSYALFIRMNDLAPSASEEFTWFYAAGAVDDLDSIASTVATAAAIGKTVVKNSVLAFENADFRDSDDNSLTKIRISTLPQQGTFQVNGNAVTLNQEILNVDFPSLTYTPNENYTGDDSFEWEAFVVDTFIAPSVANIFVIGVPGAPIAISAVPDLTSAKISFTPPADDGNDTIISYTASCDAGTPATGLASPLTVTGLNANTPYSCSVIATNSVGDSSSSNIVVTAQLAIDVISTYADDNTQTTPTVQDYINAGVDSIDDMNLAAVNAAVDTLDSTGVDTTAKIQTVIDSVNALASVTDTIANSTPITATELNEIIGVSGADSGIDYTDALATGTYVDPANPTPAEVQTVINSANSILAPAPAPDPAPTPGVVVDPTIDEDPLEFIAGSEAGGQQAVVDLSTDIVKGLTLIDHIRATTDLININNTPVQYMLESQTGLLSVQWNKQNAILRPVSVIKLENEEQSGISTTEDGEVQLITENGRKIISQVEVQVFDELTKTIDEQFGLEIERDADNNLSVFQHKNSDNLDTDIRYNVRPAFITEQVDDGSEKTGLYEYEFSDLPNVTGYYHQFVENEQLYRQYMYSTPVNWNSLKNHLNNFSGIEVVSMNINGEVYVRLDGVDYNGRMGAKVNLVDKNQPLLDETYLINMNDTNGDGKDDFKVVYPNGEWQMLYLLE